MGLSQTEWARLDAVLENTRHLRGSRNMTDLAFAAVESQRERIRELWIVIGRRDNEIIKLERTWCIRIAKWFKRAISQA